MSITKELKSWCHSHEGTWDAKAGIQYCPLHINCWRVELLLGSTTDNPIHAFGIGQTQTGAFRKAKRHFEQQMEARDEH